MEVSLETENLRERPVLHDIKIVIRILLNQSNL